MATKQRYKKKSESQSRCTLYCKSRAKGGGNRYLYAQFNPTTLPFEYASNISVIKSPGMNYPIMQYVGGEECEFDIELFFHDRPFTGSIARDRKWIKSLLPPRKNKKKPFVPPVVDFKWGYFTCKFIARRMRVEDQLLDKKGRPLITKITITALLVGNTTKF